MISDIMSEIVNEFNQYMKDRPFKPKILVGQNNLNNTDVGSAIEPRIVWFPVRESFYGTRHPGLNPKQVRSCLIDIEVHFFAKDYNTLEYMRNDWIVAMHNKIHEPSFPELSGEYEDKGQNSQEGFGYTLAFTMDTVIWDRPLRTVKLTDVESQSHFKDSNEYVPPNP